MDRSFKNTCIQINSDFMGQGDPELGRILIKNYLKVLSEEREAPTCISLYNSGVLLACEGSNVIEELKSLEQKGVKVLACTTCLNYFDKLNSLKVGITATMMDIVLFQKLANKVYTV